MSDPAELEYRFVETSLVTDDEMSRIVNEVTQEGWYFDGIRFAMTVASRRPSMAFLIFTRGRKPDPESSKPDPE